MYTERSYNSNFLAKLAIPLAIISLSFANHSHSLIGDAIDTLPEEAKAMEDDNIMKYLDIWYKDTSPEDLNNTLENMKKNQF